MMLTPGTLINGRYQLEAVIGQGATGAVYRATDRQLGKIVALKHLTVAAWEATFEREARLLASLRHPALPLVRDFFTSREGPFLAMNYVPGDDLAQLLENRNTPLPLATTLRWGGQLIAVLEYLHGRTPPLIHRDLKPGNLKIGANDQVMLLDFGLAKDVVSGQGAAPLSVLGYTPQYAPLEQIQGAGTDRQSDYYALAATLYHLLTGSPPADALTRAAAVIRQFPDPLATPHSLNPAISPLLDATLCHYLELNLDARPSRLLPLRDALKLGIAAPSQAGLAPARRPQSSSAGKATIFADPGSSAGKATFQLNAQRPRPIQVPRAPTIPLPQSVPLRPVRQPVAPPQPNAVWRQQILKAWLMALVLMVALLMLLAG